MKVKLLDHTDSIELKIAEMAGICYDSKTTNPKQLVKRLKASGHYATFRFGYVTFQISEFSRACSMQMLRHQFLSVLQRSQRFVKELQFEYVTPPDIAKDPVLKDMYDGHMIITDQLYKYYLDKGIKAEDARYILPNACHTAMNVTGSIQAWYDFLYGNAGRLQKAAQWEIRYIAKAIEQDLQQLAPSIFGTNNEQ